MIVSTVAFASDYLNVSDNQQSKMKGANLVQVLAGTLNPNTTHDSLHALQQMKNRNGFILDLLVTSDDTQVDINLRQAALVQLKNTLENHCQQSFLPPNDLDTLKASLLEALIRNVTNRKLTPTYREIVFLMAEKYYPYEWPQIVDQCLTVLQNGTDLGSLLGAVQALKAIFSVFGSSVTKEIELGNLCNKSILPLLSLASKLFQNFNEETSYVLVRIFKLFSTTIMFYIPQIVMMNIHSFMIFVKKMLDLQADLSSNDSSLYELKRISLRILFRMYQKHANRRMTQNRGFAQKFQATYTKPFVETLLMQIMLKDEGNKTARARSLQLVKLSLSCLGYINRENVEAATLLVQYRQPVLRLCFQKFKTNLNHNYGNFTEFKMSTHENRVNLQEYVISLLNCDAIREQQGEMVNSILGFLLDNLEKGDNEQRELALSLFTQISKEIRELTDKLDEKMIAMVLTYVRPLLGGQHHIMIRARACELISSYNYLDLPEEQITGLAELIYSCMLVGTSDKQIFLKIYACNAFNSLMKYQCISEFIRPFIPDILKMYTDLLKADASIIKNFEDLIDLLEDEVAPFANNLTHLFIEMFAGYAQNNGNESPFQQGNQQEEDEDEDQNQDGGELNNETCARGCISCIRQILKASGTVIEPAIAKQLFDLMLWVFADKNQDYIEEGFNVLNLLLYKLQTNADHQFFLFFRVIAYAILGISRDYVEGLRRKGDNFSLNYADILQNVSIDPDKDLLENSIGCLRNFIAKSSGNYLRNEADELNISYMEYIFRMVKTIHENPKASQTERLIVLTLFISLIEYEAVNEGQLGEITGSVQKWMQMEEEAVQGQILQNQKKNMGMVADPPRFVYSPVYLQILLLATSFYKGGLQQINVNLVVERIIALNDHFKCESELSRIIFGFAHLLENQVIGEEPLVRGMLEALPEFVERLCIIRQQGDSPENDYDMDDEAIEEKVFGEDENTHLLGWDGPAPSNKDMMLGGEDEESESDWEEEFNKYYISPLDKVDELKFLQEVMTRMGHIYGPYMSQEKQEKLSHYFSNAPPKVQSS